MFLECLEKPAAVDGIMIAEEEGLEDDDDYQPSSDDDESDEEEEEHMTEELLCHEVYAKEDILCPEMRVMRSSSKAKRSIPAEVQSIGKGDIGRRVARVVPGEGLCFGKVVNFEYDSEEENETRKEMKEEDSWFIKYDDGDDKEVGKRDIEEAFQFAKREEWYDKLVSKRKIRKR